MTDEQLALAIGQAVLEAIKAYQPEPQVIKKRIEYLTLKNLAESFGKSRSTIHTIIKEIKEQVELGRYPDDSVLEGCGVVVRLDVFKDYLAHRKALKDPVASQYVAAFENQILAAGFE